MPLAYWCILVAAMLPIFWAAVAKSGGDVDNHRPRESTANLPPMYRRAYAAHYNAYENFPFFAAAVIIAVTQGAAIVTVNWLAVAYIVLRFAHGVAYVLNYCTVRSGIFGLALLANLAIFLLPAFK
ncbi:MAG: MAPEG family protein [Xanthobacteraceae bacterium]|nr:MAPEG family protein [Xanthobacteraceae bacterium]